MEYGVTHARHDGGHLTEGLGVSGKQMTQPSNDVRYLLTDKLEYLVNSLTHRLQHLHRVTDRVHSALVLLDRVCDALEYGSDYADYSYNGVGGQQLHSRAHVLDTRRYRAHAAG